MSALLSGSISESISKSRPRKRISLTALIDVVFILLMFFMLTSTFNKWKTITINTPTGNKEAATEKPQVLILTENNSFYLDNQENTKTALLSELISKLDSSKSLILLPEKKVTVQSIISTMETLKNTGFSQLSLGSAVKGSQ